MDKYGMSPQKSDLLAVALSFLAGIIQLLLFMIGTLGKVSNFQKLFINPEVLPFLVMISMVVALCIVGTISFFKRNTDFIRHRTRFKPFLWMKRKFFIEGDNAISFAKKSVKVKLLIGLVFLVLFSFIFLISLLVVLNQTEYLFINFYNVGFYQSTSFMFLWILATVILYVWISEEIEKNYQFKADDFFPNLIKSLYNQGHIQIVIKSDIQLQTGNHVAEIKIQDTDKYFLVQFDGKKIIKELSKIEYEIFFKNRE